MKCHRLCRIALVLAVLLSVVACNKAERSAPAAPGAGVAAESAMEAPASAVLSATADAADTPPDAEAQLASSATTYTDAQRKFIRTAHAAFSVKDVYRSALAIEDLVAAQGGFVVKNTINAQVRNTQRRSIGDDELLELAEVLLQGELTVRVPSEKTQSFLRTMAREVQFLDNRSFAAEDAQFEILRQQLAYQRQQAAQQDLSTLARSGGKPKDGADIVGARTGAQTARDEAELARREFEDRVAFSTIELSLHQSPIVRKTVLPDIDAIFKAHRPSFFTRLGAALLGGWQWALDLVVVAMNLWPLWLLLLGIGYVLHLLRKRARKPAGS